LPGETQTGRIPLGGGTTPADSVAPRPVPIATLAPSRPPNNRDTFLNFEFDRPPGWTRHEQVQNGTGRQILYLVPPGVSPPRESAEVDSFRRSGARKFGEFPRPPLAHALRDCQFVSCRVCKHTIAKESRITAAPPHPVQILRYLPRSVTGASPSSSSSPPPDVARDEAGILTSAF